MGNLGASQNGQPGATNAGQGQGATGTTALGNSALGYVVDNTGLGTAQTALRQSGIQPAAFLAAGAAAAAGTHTMVPTAPPWPYPHPGLKLAPELLNAVMGMPDGAGAAAQPATLLGGGGMPQNATANAAAAAGPTPPAYPNFGQHFPGTINNQAVRGDRTMGAVDTAALTLLGQVANMSPPAGPTGRGGSATAAAGVGGATGGPNMGQTGMNSNVGGGVNQAIAGGGEGPRPPGVGPGAAAAAAAGIPPPPRTFPFGLPRGAPTPPAGGAPFGTTAHVPLPQQATAAGGTNPSPRWRAARHRSDHGGGERWRTWGPIWRDRPVRTADPADTSHANSGPTAATSTAAGTSGHPSRGNSRQRSGTAGGGPASVWA